MGVVVSVVVVARNEERHIASCLESVLAQDYPRDQYEVIVVDGGSTDRTAQIARQHPVTVVVSDRAVIGHQRNLGVTHSLGRYVAFTDADCVADGGWLAALAGAMEAAGTEWGAQTQGAARAQGAAQAEAAAARGVAAVGGPNLVFESDPWFARLVGHMQGTLGGSGGSAQSYSIATPRRVRSLPNCNAMYRREALEAERYDDAISCGDDLDLNYRLARRGHAFQFVPGAVVRHHRPAGIGAFARKMYLYGEAMGRVTRKNRGVVRWYAFTAGLGVIGLVLAYPLVRFVPYMGYAYLAAAAVYLGLLCVATFQVAARLRTPASLLTLLLLPLQHLVYGVGFLKGLAV